MCSLTDCALTLPKCDVTTSVALLLNIWGLDEKVPASISGMTNRVSNFSKLFLVWALGKVPGVNSVIFDVKVNVVVAW